MNHTFCALVLLGAIAALSGCGDPTSSRDARTERAHPLLGDADEVRMGAADEGALGVPLANAFKAVAGALESGPTLEALVVAQPDEGATIAGDDRPPRFLWRDPAEAADTWWIRVRFGQSGANELQLLVPGGMPAEAMLDPVAATLQAWTPSAPVWSHIVKHGKGTPVVVTLVGFAADAPDAPRSRGAVTITVAAAR